jgi:hypothetical protein
LMLVHISNHYLDLRPVVGNLAASAGGVAFLGDDLSEDQKNPPQGWASSQWVIIAKDRETVGAIVDDAHWKPLPPAPHRRLWTDDYSNILAVFRWRYR